MAPKKKAENTENIVEEVLVEQETMEAPKPKRKMTEAQKSNFNKLQAANKIRYEARRIAKEEVGEPIKDPLSKNVNDEILENKEAFIQKEITKKKTQVRKKKEPLLESEEEEAPMVVKKTAKKKKRRIVVEQDSSSSDEEIVISRRRRSKKPVVLGTPHPPSAPIPIPTNHNDNRSPIEEDTAPIEKDKPKKIEKVIPELKEYTHVQILKGLGL